MTEVRLTKDYSLKIDRYNFVLYHDYVSTKERSEGKPQTELIGYYRDLFDVANAIIKCEQDNATDGYTGSITEYAQFIKEVTENATQTLLAELKDHLKDKPKGWYEVYVDDND